MSTMYPMRFHARPQVRPGRMGHKDALFFYGSVSSDEWFDSLTPDFVLHVQRRDSMTGEQRLAWALVESAKDDAFGLVWVEVGYAVWWLFYELSDRACSLLWCCSLLSLERDWIRRLIRQQWWNRYGCPLPSEGQCREVMKRRIQQDRLPSARLFSRESHA